MNINTESCTKSELKKQCFNMKRRRKDGLALRIHHTEPSTSRLRTVRFLHASFNATGGILAVANHSGQIFIIDFDIGKYWYLDTLVDLTAMKFIPGKKDELLVGTGGGSMHFINVRTEARGAELQGHDCPVTNFTFSTAGACISTSASEAVIWDLDALRKVQMLQSDGGSVIKMAIFMPITHNILVCFQDDIMQVWKGDTLEPLKHILPCTKNKISVRTIAFTENEKAMVVGGHSPDLTVLLIETWTILQTISLHPAVQAVKKLEFVPRPFDGGANKILAILTSGGTIIFYNMEIGAIASTLNPDNEIRRFSLSPHGRMIACTMNSSDVRLYELAHFLGTNINRKQVTINKSGASVTGRKTSFDKRQMKEALNVDKLKMILREYREYPDRYRKTIWTGLLSLPNDKAQYDAVTRNTHESPFVDLETCYPLVNKQDLRNLKRTLGNVVSWCPFLAEVSYLPLFCYPFVRYFHNEPILCFEVIIMIIVNYCQYWFEYHPLLPLNILGMIENILIENDPVLITHFNDKQITSTTYAWPLLQTAFSEVLSGHEWLVFWDHVVSNEPAFLLVAVASYSIVNRGVVLAYSTSTEIAEFYGGQNAFDFQRFIGRTYKLLLGKKNNPQHYLDRCKNTDDGVYPKFTDFPRASVEYSRLTELRRERLDLMSSERELMATQSQEIEKLKHAQRENEEIIRLADLQRHYQKKINEEQAHVVKQRERLNRLSSQRRAYSKNTIAQRSPINDKTLITIKPVSGKHRATSADIKKTEEKLVDHYTVLLRHKLQIEKLINGDLDVDYQKLEADYGNLTQEIEKAKSAINDTGYLKQLNITTGLEAIDILIDQVESELLMQGGDCAPKYSTSYKVHKLAEETKELSKEVNELICLITRAG